MNILFNGHKSGLGNNGGTKTIVNSINVINRLSDNKAYVIGKNYYTWNNINHIILQDITRIYDNYFDYIINVSIIDVEQTISINEKTKIPIVWWLRGWEKWVYGEEELIRKIKKFAKYGKILANSSWLVDHVKEKCGVDCVLCFAGVDIDFWQDRYYNLKCEKNKLSYGATIYERHPTKNSNILYFLQDDYVKNKKINFRYINIKDGLNDDALKYYYYSLNGYVAPTELEGFHNSAAEAALCGCLVFCNRKKENGMGDYANELTAERFSSVNELKHKLENPNFDKITKMMEQIIKKVGTREENMKKFINILKGS